MKLVSSNQPPHECYYAANFKRIDHPLMEFCCKFHQHWFLMNEWRFSIRGIWEDGVYQSRLPLVPFASVGWHLNTCVTGLGLCQLNLWLRFASFVGGSAAIDKVGKALGDARQYTTGEDQKRSTLCIPLCLESNAEALPLPVEVFLGLPDQLWAEHYCCHWLLLHLSCNTIDFKW